MEEQKNKKGEFKIPSKIPKIYYKVVGYCKDTNTIYKYHGSYFHGNPNIYEPDLWNAKLKN